MIGVVITLAATAWLVASTVRESQARYIAKPLASAGFLITAITGPLAPGTRATLVFAGLVLGATGDMALMGQSDRAFITGLVAFLAGHIAYVVAFALDVGPLLWFGAAVASVLVIVVLRWLRPFLSPAFHLAVPVYVVVIAAMVAVGIGSARAYPLAGIGAVLFAASDVFVARERFVHSSALNPVLGLPLYYAGQLAIAITAIAG